MSQNSFKITSKRCRFSIRLQYIIFPFNGGEIMNALAKTNMGYVLPPPPKGNVSIDNLDVSGPIAKKGNTTIDFDSVSQILGVDGLDATEVINVFSELWDIIQATLEPKIENKTIFYEFLINYTVSTGQNPLDVLGKLKYENGLSDSISEILEENASNYSIHVCSPDIVIDNPDWYDIQIRPHGRKPAELFDVMIVYRKSEKTKVEKFGNNHKEKIRDIFKILS